MSEKVYKKKPAIVSKTKNTTVQVYQNPDGSQTVTFGKITNKKNGGNYGGKIEVKPKPQVIG